MPGFLDREDPPLLHDLADQVKAKATQTEEEEGGMGCLTGGFASGSALREVPYLRRAVDASAGLVQPASVGFTVVPGATTSSMRSRSAVSSSTSAAPSCDSSCSIVRGPMIAAVTAGCRMTNASAKWISDMPDSSARCASASAASSLA